MMMPSCLSADSHLLPLLEGVVSRGLPLRFHTPNGMHVGLITPRLARWLKRANFATLRLGLETTATGTARLDRKIQAGDLERAVAALLEAGFTSSRHRGLSPHRPAASGR